MLKNHKIFALSAFLVTGSIICQTEKSILDLLKKQQEQVVEAAISKKPTYFYPALTPKMANLTSWHARIEREAQAKQAAWLAKLIKILPTELKIIVTMN